STSRWLGSNSDALRRTAKRPARRRRRVETLPHTVAAPPRIGIDRRAARSLPRRSWHMTSPRRAALWVVLLTGLPSLALAQCTTKTDASAFKNSVKLAAKCNLRRLQRGPTVTCKTSSPPACAGTLATDAVALAWGANNPAAAAIDRRLLRDQYDCQKAISKGVVDF